MAPPADPSRGVVTATQTVRVRGFAVHRHCPGVECGTRGHCRLSGEQRRCRLTCHMLPAGWPASSAGGDWPPYQWADSRRTCRSNSGRPDGDSGREMLTLARLAPRRRERAKLVKLDREAFVRVIQRSAQPIGYMNGARSRVGGAIGQTELTLPRMRVDGDRHRRHGGLEVWGGRLFPLFPLF